jgi:rubredoxin
MHELMAIGIEERWVCSSCGHVWECAKAIERLSFSTDRLNVALHFDLEEAIAPGVEALRGYKCPRCETSQPITKYARVAKWPQILMVVHERMESEIATDGIWAKEFA